MARSINKNETTLEDLENMLGENGGLGEWESDEEADTIDRWYFPRYAPICPKHGQMIQDEDNAAHFTCATKSCKHEAEVDAGDMYLSRSGLGPYDSDVETVEAWLQAPRNIVGAILALGEPGTGKTALIEAAVTRLGREMTTVVCTPDHTKDSLFLRFVGEGRGDDDQNGHPTPYVLGPIPYAAKHGHVLYMDEFMLLVDGVKPLVYPLADGRRFLPEGNVDGSPMEVHPDFRLVLSSNPQVRGASLPEPVASRCAGTTITVETSKEMLTALGLDETIIATWMQLGQRKLWRPQIRELRVANYWLSLDPEQASSAFLPEHAPASQRADIVNVVKANIGADLRNDGRLVVK